MTTAHHPHYESPDLLRTTLLFNLGTIHVQNVLKDSKAFKSFDIFDEVKAGRLTDIDQEIQHLQKKMYFEEIARYLNQKDKDGKTPLFYACYFNYQNIILYLLSKGADPFLTDEEGRNCFFVLAFKGLTESISIVINYYRHVFRRECLAKVKEIKKAFGFLKSDIHKGELVSPDQHVKSVRAKFNEFLPIVERIFREEYLDQLYNFQEKALLQIDILNRTPIHYSAMSKYTKCGLATKMLLMNQYDKTEGYEEFQVLWDELQLLELNADKREDTKLALHLLELVENMLSKETFNEYVDDFKRRVASLQKKIINLQDRDGYTPMHLASFYGDFLLVQFMLLHGGDQHVKDNKDHKAALDHAANRQVRRVLLDLKEAARRGDVESFEALLNSEEKNKIDDRTTIFSIAPIHNAVQHAAQTKNHEMLDFIIKCGANVNVNDVSGWTPLHHACQKGDLETVKELVENEAYINVFSNRHLFPIHIAALNNHHRIIEYLFDHDADIECQNDEGCTPLHLAAKKGHVESMKTLLELGANIYALDMRSWTALHYASYNGHGKAVNLLCKYDSDFEKLREMRNSQGKTAKEIAPNENIKFQFNTIWKAAFDGNLDFLRRLHRFGEDIDAQTPLYKLTPLMIATQKHHLLVVKYLLDNGATVDLADANGRTAYEYSVLALNLIKIDKKTKSLIIKAGQKVIDEKKATKNEYEIKKNGKREYYPDLVSRIEKTYKLFV